MKHLIIVESPSKAKTIKNFLGKEYEVLASKGHIRDLPKTRMGIKIESKQFLPEYRVDKEHSAVVKQLKDAAKDAQTLYIATDEDREGEAIGFHIAHALGKDPDALPRIVFHEITKNAITEALKHPRTIDMRRVNAQQARRLLDRLVGYNLSPLLGSKIQKGLSAGRVQSSALKIVVDREREIQAFKPEEYWSIDGLFAPNIEAALVAFEGEKLEKMSIRNGDEAHRIKTALDPVSFTVESIETKERKTSAPPPFMTSTLQQVASTQLGFSPKKTMMLAQTLYEGVPTDHGTTGVITYMRTDSLYITPEANNAAREMIQKSFGDAYLAPEVRVFKTKAKGAQEAHEAIRPTNLDFTPEIAAKYLKRDELRLYALIYNRFLATQMADARFETQNIFIAGGEGRFKASGRRLIFDGFYRVVGNEDKDKLLPPLTENAPIDKVTIDANQHFTEPPKRYSEAGLVKTLETLGIGRPSTYAPTISTLQARDYIQVEKKQIIPTKIAFTVTELLEKHFAEIVDTGFTATMEEELDLIAEEQKDWQQLLYEFYEPFIQKIQSGKKEIASQKVAEPIGEACPKCGAELVKRSGRFGEFISCSTYPKCKYTRSLEEKAKPEPTGLICEKCGAPMVVKSGRRGKFYACSNYPECKNTKPIEPPKTLDVPCPKCGGTLQERSSKRGKFFGCSNYPECDFISKYPPTDEKCPQCGTVMAKRTFRGKEVFECLNPECKHRQDA